MLKKIYLTFLCYPISFVMNFFGFAFRPFMVYGYWNYPSRSFRKFTRYSSTTVFLHKKKIDIADNCWIGPNCIIDGSGGVVIGKGVQIAGLTAIYSHSSHRSIRLCGDNYINLNPENRAGYSRQQVVVGDYCFLGVSSIILPGVVIGKGCLLAAGAVVKESMPDYSIVAGNPAKVIGSTLDMDKEYFGNLNVRESYFAPEVIAKFKSES